MPSDSMTRSSVTRNRSSGGLRSGATTELGWRSNVMATGILACWRASSIVWPNDLLMTEVAPSKHPDGHAPLRERGFNSLA